MFSSKRGVEMTTVVILVLIIAGFAFSARIVDVLTREAGTTSVETLCRSSVLARAEARFNYLFEDRALAPLLCRTQDVEIEKTSESAIKAELANLADRCWWQMANGAYQSSLWSGTDWIANGKQACFVCYNVVIAKERGDLFSGEELEAYMADTYYQSVETTEGEVSEATGDSVGERGDRVLTHLDYIQYDAHGELKLFTGQDEEAKKRFEPGVVYAVVYWETGIDEDGRNVNRNTLLIDRWERNNKVEPDFNKCLADIQGR